MKIIYKVGNLLNGLELCKIHGCNAQGVMRSGIAKVIREAYHEVYDDYMLQHQNGKLKLGEVFPVICEDTIIINAVTQKFYGYDNKIYCDYGAIRTCMKKSNLFCKEHNIADIAMPKIGAGLGGGDWDTISKIIEEEFTDAQPYVYILKEAELPLHG